MNANVRESVLRMRLYMIFNQPDIRVHLRPFVAKKEGGNRE